MNSQMLPPEAREYLRQLERLLADLPADACASALDDVTAHIEESLDSGRTVTDTMAGLGSVEGFAAQYRDELRVPTASQSGTAQPATLRQTGLLHLVSVGVALLACVFAAFLSPAASVSESSGSSGGSDDGATTTLTFVEAYGPGGIALLLAPALLALLPLLLPSGWRTPVSLVNALVITGFAALTGFTIGMFYVPLAVMMWTAVIVPWRMGKGLAFANAPLWRIFGGVLIALPALLLVPGGLSGAVLADPPLWIGTVAVIALGAAFAIGMRASALVVALLGLGVMVFVMTEGSMFAIAFWWIGGLYLACGIAAFVAWGTKEPQRPRTPQQSGTPQQPRTKGLT